MKINKLFYFKSGNMAFHHDFDSIYLKGKYGRSFKKI